MNTSCSRINALATLVMNEDTAVSEPWQIQLVAECCNYVAKDYSRFYKLKPVLLAAAVEAGPSDWGWEYCPVFDMWALHIYTEFGGVTCSHIPDDSEVDKLKSTLGERPWTIGWSGVKRQWNAFENWEAAKDGYSFPDGEESSAHYNEQKGLLPFSQLEEMEELPLFQGMGRR